MDNSLIDIQYHHLTKIKHIHSLAIKRDGIRQHGHDHMIATWSWIGLDCNNLTIPWTQTREATILLIILCPPFNLDFWHKQNKGTFHHKMCALTK